MKRTVHWGMSNLFHKNSEISAFLTETDQKNMQKKTCKSINWMMLLRLLQKTHFQASCTDFTQKYTL